MLRRFGVLCCLLLIFSSTPAGQSDDTASFELQSDGLAVVCEVFRHGDYVGVDFRFNKPLQADDALHFLEVFVARGEDFYMFRYRPTFWTGRREVFKQIDGEWDSQPDLLGDFAGSTTAQTVEGWTATVWIKSSGIAARVDETWRMGFRYAGRRTASHPEELAPDKLARVNMSKVKTRESGEIHPAVAAVESEQRVMATLEKVNALEAPGEKLPLLKEALQDDPHDPTLWAETIDAIEDASSDRRGEMRTYRTATERCPGWVHVHHEILREMLLAEFSDAAAEYFLTWERRLPRMETKDWRAFYATGCKALALQGMWKELEDRIIALTDQDLLELGGSFDLLDSIDEALVAGKEEIAGRLRDRMLDADQDAGHQAEIQVRWLKGLVRAGLATKALDYARTLVTNKHVMKKDGRGFASSCINALAMAYDPPEAADKVATLMLDGKNHFTEQMQKDLSKFEQACRDAAEDWEKELSYRKEDAAKQNPRMRLETDRGVIVIELFEDDAPNTAANFVKLVRDGFFEDRELYRREDGWLVQGGSPTNDNTAESEWKIKNEENRRQHWRGTIGVARGSELDSGSTHFFITIGNVPHSLTLGTDWVVFGRVVEGLEIAQRLQEGDKITSATTENLRNHDYEPKRIPAEKK